MTTFNLRKGYFLVDEENGKFCFYARGKRDKDGTSYRLDFKVKELLRGNRYNVEINKTSYRSGGGSTEYPLCELTVQKTTKESSLINDGAIEFNCESGEDLLLAILCGGSPNHMALTKAIQLALIEENVKFLSECPSVGEFTLSFNSSTDKLKQNVPLLQNSFEFYQFSAFAKNFIGQKKKLDFIISTFEEGDSVRVELTSFDGGGFYDVNQKGQSLVCNFSAESLPDVYREYVKIKEAKGNFGDIVLSNLLDLGGQLFNKRDVVDFLANRVREVFCLDGENSLETLKSLNVYGKDNSVFYFENTSEQSALLTL